MGKYITLEDVQKRLVGKVSFTEDEAEENKMHVDLANRLLAEAETVVELDMSIRYATPFVTTGDEPFSELPGNPTRNVIRAMCELQAVSFILDIDFGYGSVVDSDSYVKRLEKRYESYVTRLLAKRKDGGTDGQGWRFPPLPGLKLNWFNEDADDGYQGSIYVTSQGDGDFPAKQINDPSETFFRYTHDD